MGSQAHFFVGTRWYSFDMQTTLAD